MSNKSRFSECIARGIAGSVWGLIFFVAIPVILSYIFDTEFASIGYMPLICIMGSLGLVMGFIFNYLRCKKILN